jgi:DNA mismatch repair protein MutL
MLKNITVQEGVSQQLLFPLALEFSKSDLRLLEKVKQQLEHTGFVFSEMNEAQVLLEGIPAFVPETAIQDLLDRLLMDIRDEVP